MKTKLSLLLYLILLSTCTVFGQNNTDRIQWSATQKLTADDFLLKIKSRAGEATYGQFGMDYQVNGLNFLSKNFNKKVHARMLRKAFKENKMKLLKGMQVAAELNDQIMAEFTKKRADYSSETKFGADTVKQKEWDATTQKMLMALNEFAYEK